MPDVARGRLQLPSPPPDEPLPPARAKRTPNGTPAHDAPSNHSRARPASPGSPAGNGNGRHDGSGSPQKQHVSSSDSDSHPSPPSSESSSSLSEPDDAAPPKPRDPVHADPKVLKLPPTRLGELLVNTPTPFELDEPRPDSPAASRPRLTNPSAEARDPARTARPPQNRSYSTAPRDRGMLAAPTMRRTRSSPRPLDLTTHSPVPELPPLPEGNWMAARGSGTLSPTKTGQSTNKSPGAKLSFGGDAAQDLPRPVPTRSLSTLSSPDMMGKESNSAGRSPTPVSLPAGSTSSFPPLPLQSYLSLALSATAPSAHIHSPIPSPHNPEATHVPASAPVYGSPPHHPDSSSDIAMERIVNMLKLPAKLEGALFFGVLACLDSWLYMFTILPLRFLKALGVLGDFWAACMRDYLMNPDGKKLQKAAHQKEGEDRAKRKAVPARKRERKKTSDLLPSQKADLLRGLVVFITCWFLMLFDASKMYHTIRGQNGIKLYVIYNMLEFGDRLCAAIGQDIFECLFSRQTLERGPDGRSKLLRPFGLLLLALVYNMAHSLVLFYQVITLNVAVNSYSNALMTLLLSVQFVEIKTTVFKKFEKENLFQLACADVVERFQLLLMLTIIAARNLVEIGVWSLSGSSASSTGILPKAFTISLPMLRWAGQIVGPFIMVLGSEMAVDWLKHMYITKFNNTRPVIYERILDVQCKDYYSTAFSDQNLTKRLGLPVIPLACLFIRSTIQTYHMFLATAMPHPEPSSSTSLTPSSTPSASTAALASLDTILRRALGRSSFGGNVDPATSFTDDAIAAVTMILFLLCCFLVFLAVKLVLGVALLGFARRRYRAMKDRERISAHTGARRVGGFGVVEVTDDVRRAVHEGDEEGVRKAREAERKGREKDMNPDMASMDTVMRYDMVAKRIW